MSSINILCFSILTSIILIDYLPCVNCQLPNIYDLTWFDSFSLENYGGFLNRHETKLGSNKDQSSNFPNSDPLDDKIMSANQGFEKLSKTTEDNNESADASLEEGGHFDSRFVQQSDRRTQRIMQELTEACQQNSACSSRTIPIPFERLACIRKCVSPNCYAAVYLDQPLEPGEIDVKYSKYKACFHRHWKSRYSRTYDHLNEL